MTIRRGGGKTLSPSAIQQSLDVTSPGSSGDSCATRWMLGSPSAPAPACLSPSHIQTASPWGMLPPAQPIAPQCPIPPSHTMLRHGTKVPKLEGKPPQSQHHTHCWGVLFHSPGIFPFMGNLCSCLRDLNNGLSLQ